MSLVLLATDGSDLATAAMARGVDLLGRDHTFVSLAVVAPAFVPGAAVNPMDSHPTVVDPALEQELEQEDRAELAADLDQLDQILEITSEHLLDIGDPGITICEIAARIHADVVVIGSHGHGWLQRVLIGSVSRHVLQHAPCAVLVMRLEDTRAG